MIYLVDTIGAETGMHKYDDSFVSQCMANGVGVSVVSNYDGQHVRFMLHNYYRGGKLKRCLYLAMDLLRWLAFVPCHRNDTIVYQSFGLRPLDKLFYLPLLGDRKAYMIVHDMYEITAGHEGKHGRNDFWYSRLVRNFICHSRQVKSRLESLSRRPDLKVLYTPHLEYEYSTSYDMKNVREDVRSSVVHSATNYLVFGQMRRNKGVDVAIAAWASMKGSTRNLIVAGIDKEHVLDGVASNGNIKVVNRYIGDDELNYLFSTVDAVILPYREIFQSGVLETVVHFGRQCILSPIEAFSSYLEEYPSFGVLMGELTPEALVDAVNSFDPKSASYSETDVAKYAENHNLSSLLREMGEI